MSKCKAVLDGDKITSIKVKTKPLSSSSPTGTPAESKTSGDPKRVSTVAPQKSK